MHRYIIRRLLLNIPVLFLVTLGTFSMIRVVPGDAVMNMIQEAGTVPKERLAEVRHQLGLDRPFWVQYGSWLKGVFMGDMGQSIYSKKSVAQELIRTIPVSIQLGIMAIIVALLIALPVGIVSAIRQDSVPDYVGRLFAIGGLSIPDFWMGTVFMVFVPLLFGYLPTLGYIPFFDDPWANIQQFIWPALILGVRLSSVTMRMMRSAMLEVLRQDYIRTAWAKGMRERSVIIRHAMKNAMIPVITIIGNQSRIILGGTVIMEVIFALPGMGRLTFDSINLRDYPQIQANVTFLATAIILINLFVDLTYAWFDPRIRYR